jgi:hypothetical protein
VSRDLFGDEPTRPDPVRTAELRELEALRADNVRLRARLAWILELAEAGGVAIPEGRE